MGTRGFYGVVIDGQAKLTYNQYDSYPSGLGTNLLAWLRAQIELENVGTLQAHARALRLITLQDGDPTQEDWNTYGQYADTHVSTGKDWYALLRQTQGDLGVALEIGVMEDADDFPLDSLFCEWGYVVDLDTMNFDVYQGFQKKVPTSGLWEGSDHTEASGYRPCNRIARISFDELPDTELFAALEDARDAMAEGDPLPVALKLNPVNGLLTFKPSLIEEPPVVETDPLKVGNASGVRDLLKESLIDGLKYTSIENFDPDSEGAVMLVDTMFEALVFAGVLA